MNRDSDKISARRQYVKGEVDRRQGLTIDTVKNLANELFLSEATIWNDLKSNSKDEN